MGLQKYLTEIEKLLKKSGVIDYGSIERLIQSQKKVKQYAKQLTRNLVAKGRMNRLTKGCYTLHDDPSLAVFCFKPSYLGLQDALSFHGIWEQETIPIIITAGKARPGIRRVLELNAAVRRINKRYLFGFEYYRQGDFYLPYSDVEKTLIDMIYFKEKLDKETLVALREKLDLKKLNVYLKAYPTKTRQNILRQIK